MRPMRTGVGKLVERFLDGGGRVTCDPDLVPPAGQYISASSHAGEEPLAVPLFAAKALPDGFLAAPDLPQAWQPGRELFLRGPIGRGFHLPRTARRVMLAAIDASPGRLMTLANAALAQGAAVVFVGDLQSVELPDIVEVQPMATLREVVEWADYAAMAWPRAGVKRLLSLLGTMKPAAGAMAEVLMETSLPCSGVGECGACAVPVRGGWKLACKDGPVLPLSELVG